MAWPYHFLELTEAEKHERRLSLDRHAGYAQLSALLPVAVFLCIRFAQWAKARVAARKVAYDVVPGSPAAKYRREIISGSWKTTGRKLKWWLGDDVILAGQSWGRRDSLLFGGAWTLWLLFLSVQGTGQGTESSLRLKQATSLDKDD